MTSQKFPFQNGTSHCDSIFTPWNGAKLEKITFMPETIFSGTKSYPPPPPPSAFPCFSSKTKRNSYFQLFEMSHLRNNCSNPLMNQFC